MSDTLTNFSNEKFIFLILFLILVLPMHFITNIIKKKVRKSYENNKNNFKNLEEIEKAGVEYHSKNQDIDVFRLIYYIVSFLLITYIFGIQAFSTLAITFGALIVILKEPISSAFSYILLVSQYDIGDDIRIDNKLGEILRIKLLYTGIAGKEENGDYNGKYIVIPNHLFLLNAVERQELKADQYRRVLLSFIFNNKEYGKPFKNWLLDFQAKLDDMLPMRNLKQVGSYRSYAGVKYKLNYDYNDKGEVLIRVSFISKPGIAAISRKEEIIDYIESSKVNS